MFYFARNHHQIQGSKYVQQHAYAYFSHICINIRSKVAHSALQLAINGMIFDRGRSDRETTYEEAFIDIRLRTGHTRN